MGTEPQNLHKSKYSAQTVSRADELYDVMPLSGVSEVLDIPYSTLLSWSKQGWVSTDTNWKKGRSGRDKKASPKQAARLVFDQGLTRREAAERLGVHPRTVRKYISEYRDAPKPGPKPDDE
ncbi:DNA-binding HTH domain-containing protein [Salinibacter phage M1EM-1]|uniref:DNA-binding HTH domain-containing protein n=1 Tax=Salinibacter phage M1EM-1 TaxID=2681616 RepID=A0A2I6UG31_9CAUD|nr:DNA-binding HTH domain-containing protein [Salinibacter phage M1EM-1]AUO78935.1 DNA-binding HTH domain-containing protein [Salinibacter phage M1EM-1]